MRQASQLPLFARPDGLRGLDGVTSITTAAYFDDHMDAIGSERNDVGLAPAASVVALGDPIAARFQI